MASVHPQPSKSGTIPHHETFSLIASDKVEGTPVYRPDGEKAGHIENVMIDKRSGQVAYAVMSFGGFLGLGEGYYPVPWSLLTYNPKRGGYEVNISEGQLENAPRFSDQGEWDWDNPESGRRIQRHYSMAFI